MGFRSRLAHAFNILTDQNEPLGRDYGYTYSGPPVRRSSNVSNERSIINAIYVRLAVDVAGIDIRHVRLDEQNRYLEDIDSRFNECLSTESNIDQSGQDLIQDAVDTMLNEGVVGIVPIEMSADPQMPGSWEILNLRVCSITNWMPYHVQISVYNELTGRHEQKTVDKKYIAIIHNPFYKIMNEPNSTFQRIVKKLNLLDTIDENSASTKLDLIVQLPYTVRTETLQRRANQRMRDMEAQLGNSKFGIAYSDGTEKITQLNRPVENNIMPQIEFLMTILHSQMGITKGVMEGTAEEAEMLNYINRTLVPILDGFRNEFRRKFLTKTARSQKQDVLYFRDPFKLVPMSDLAEMADKFTRNEIVTGNEFRGFIGLRPVQDPAADQLRNKNMPTDDTGAPQVVAGEVVEGEVVEADPIAEIEATVEGLLAKLEA